MMSITEALKANPRIKVRLGDRWIEWRDNVWIVKQAKWPKVLFQGTNEAEAVAVLLEELSG